MKVLQVLVGGKWGGGSAVLTPLVRTMIARGDEVAVLCVADDVAQWFSGLGAKVIRAPLWMRPINPLDAFCFAQLVALCRRENYDLVATHTAKGGFLGRLAGRLGGNAAIVHHAHGFAFRESQSPRIYRLYVGLEKVAARFCDSIICVSEEHRQGALQEGVGSERLIRTVLNGIDVDAFAFHNRESARKLLGYTNDDLLVGVVNRLVPDKGIDHLIDAMVAVCERFPRARLAIVGTGAMEAELRRRAAALPCAAKIRFHGFVRGVERILPAFDVTVQPSLYEGLSISLLEAMAAGGAIVACDIQGNRNVIQDMRNGLMVPPADPASLSSAIGTLLGDAALRRELGAVALADVRHRFTTERMVREILETYDMARAVVRGDVAAERAAAV